MVYVHRYVSQVQSANNLNARSMLNIGAQQSRTPNMRLYYSQNSHIRHQIAVTSYDQHEIVLACEFRQN